MASINKVQLIGNLGKDPEMRYMPNGDAVTNMTIATSENWKDKQGEKQERTEWHRVSMFGRLAEVAGKYLKKGSSIYIEGKLQTRKWQDKDGSDRYTTEIIAHEMKMLGGRPEGGEQRAEPPQHAASRAATNAQRPADGWGGLDSMEDDIPFFDTLGRMLWMVV